MGMRGARLKRAVLLRSRVIDGGGLSGDGEESLGLAAGRDAGSANHAWSGDELAAGGGGGREGDVQEGEAGLLERDGGVSGEVLRGEVEEVEVAELGSVGIGERLESGDGGGGEEVFAVDVEDDLGVRAVGHGEVELDGMPAGAEVEDAGRVAFGLLSLGERDDVGHLVCAGGIGGVKAEVFQERGGVGEG